MPGMNEQQARKALIRLWLDKAEDAFASAELEMRAGHLSFAINRLYYGCFYAVTALLLRDGKQFSRHSAVMSEWNRSYVKTGKFDTQWSGFYQQLFNDRQESDYLPTTTFDRQDIEERIKLARELLSQIRSCILNS
jgi:uncharacterized protein (UPF0332 family)